MTFSRSLFLAASLLAGCSTPPLAMDARHPASPAAPESAPPRRTSLRADAETQRTHDLLAQRERETAAADADHAHIRSNHEHP